MRMQPNTTQTGLKTPGALHTTALVSDMDMPKVGPQTSAAAATPDHAKAQAHSWLQLNTPMAHWQGRRVWLVGASTGIGLACAQALRAAGAQVVVSARNPQGVQDWAAQDAGVQWRALDVSDAAQVQTTTRALQAEGPLDLVVYAAGYYRAQRATALDLDDLLQHDKVNYQGALQVVGAVLPDMLARQSGHISLLSSVAGWRGLPNGLGYGPTKAALTHLAETLYLDLQDQGIGVSVVNPGFVATPLTAQNQFTMPALISPEEAARQMLKGWASGQFDIHFPKRFTLWLKLLRLLPYRLYFPLVRKFTGL
jgi:NAD(P)-dependent dehydrogenase (short-subunit alcohol dehydrogenase family)